MLVDLQGCECIPQSARSLLPEASTQHGWQGLCMMSVSGRVQGGQFGLFVNHAAEALRSVLHGSKPKCAPAPAPRPLPPAQHPATKAGPPAVSCGPTSSRPCRLRGACASRQRGGARKCGPPALEHDGTRGLSLPLAQRVAGARGDSRGVIGSAGGVAVGLGGSAGGCASQQVAPGADAQAGRRAVEPQRRASDLLLSHIIIPPCLCCGVCA